MRKKVSLEALEAEHHYDTYEQEVRDIQEAIAMGRLVPLKSARSNGRRPALPLSYWLILPDRADYSDELSTLNYRLDPHYYLHHRAEYEKVRDEVLKLNAYLNNKSERLALTASKRERSYEIFGYEKVFDKHTTLLKHLGLTDADLSMYETVEPIAYYTSGEVRNVLIVENSSPYFTIRELLISGQKTICGKPIDTIVYGGGKRIFSSFRELTRSFAPHDLSQAILYYAGDIDYEGLSILEKIHHDFDIVPFIPLYRDMIEKARGRPLYKMPPKQVKPHGEVFKLFDDSLAPAISDVLSQGNYIPQEIISMMDLKENEHDRKES